MKPSFIKFYRENWWWSNCVSYQCFYSRVRTWWDWNEAIKRKKNKYAKKDYKQETKQKEERTYIDVKYNEEEAKIFKRIYEEIINSLEEAYEKEEEPKKAQEILERKKEIEREYQIFLHHNY